MRVYESWHTDSPIRLEHLTIRIDGRLDLGSRAHLLDQTSAYEHRAVFDDRKFAHRRASARALERTCECDELRTAKDGERIRQIDRPDAMAPYTGRGRSEERRVGKECRCRQSPNQ